MSARPPAAAEPYFAGLAAHEIRVQVCADCGRAVWYPREFCPYCWTARLRWTTCAGTGEVYSFSATGPEPADTVCLVRMDEGHYLMAHLDTRSGADIGTRVTATFQNDIVVFVPLDTPTGR